MLSEKSNYSHASAADTSGKADELGRKKKTQNNKQTTVELGFTR